MQQMDLILNMIGVLMILTLIGYIAGRSGYLPPNAKMYVSSLVVKITAPALIVSTLTSYQFTSETLRDGLQIFMFALVFVFFSFGVGAAVSRFLKLDGSSGHVFQAHTMFGNVGYLGMPLLNAVFGEKGLFYATIYVTVQDLIFWTFGIYLLNKHSANNWKENLKHFINANTISFATGLIFALIGLKSIVEVNAVSKAVFQVIFNTLKPLGGATLYLVMIFIGLSFAESGISSIKDFLTRRNTFVLSSFKLILIPAVGFLIINLTAGLVDPFVRSVLILELAMPCATLVAAVAAQSGSDYKLATDNIVFTTLFSIVTLPVVLFLMNTL